MFEFNVYNMLGFELKYQFGIPLGILFVFALVVGNIRWIVLMNVNLGW